MFQCPLCGDLLEALTNNHCMSRHHLSKHEMLSLYGSPKYIIPMVNREVQKWIRDAQVIRKADFEVSQAAMRNQIRRSKAPRV